MLEEQFLEEMAHKLLPFLITVEEKSKNLMD